MLLLEQLDGNGDVSYNVCIEHYLVIVFVVFIMIIIITIIIFIFVLSLIKPPLFRYLSPNFLPQPLLTSSFSLPILAYRGRGSSRGPCPFRFPQARSMELQNLSRRGGDYPQFVRVRTFTFMAWGSDGGSGEEIC